MELLMRCSIWQRCSYADRAKIKGFYEIITVKIEPQKWNDCPTRMRVIGIWCCFVTHKARGVVLERCFLCWAPESAIFFTWVDFPSIYYSCTLHNSSLVVAVSSCQRHSVDATCFYSVGFKGMSPGITWLTACNLIIVSSSVLCLVVESVQPRWLSRTEGKIISSSMYVCMYITSSCPYCPRQRFFY